jgi:hypothetical protein
MTDLISPFLFSLQGARFNRNRLQCDKKFRKDMKNICKRMGFLRRETCKTFAEVYYNAVRVGGAKRFEKRSLKYCKQKWVKKCVI